MVELNEDQRPEVWDLNGPHTLWYQAECKVCANSHPHVGDVGARMQVTCTFLPRFSKLFWSAQATSTLSTTFFALYVLKIFSGCVF